MAHGLDICFDQGGLFDDVPKKKKEISPPKDVESLKDEEETDEEEEEEEEKEKMPEPRQRTKSGKKLPPGAVNIFGGKL